MVQQSQWDVEVWKLQIATRSKVNDSWVDDAGTWTTALLGHFALRAPSRRVWWVDFGVME